MNKIYLLALATLTLSACSTTNTTPITRVHAAATVPRFVDIQPLPMEGDAKPFPVGVNAGLGYGPAYADEGNVFGGDIFHVSVNYRNKHFAAGWQPYIAIAQVSHEGTNTVGSTLWYALHFGGGEKWRFSYQNSYTATSKVAEDKGCTNATWTVFSTSCDGQPQSTTHAEVNIRDVGFVFTAEHNLGGEGSLLFVPALHWMDVKGGNKLDSNPSGDYARHDTFWNPSLQVGYVIHMGHRFHSAVAVLAGAEYAKTFRPDRVTRDWVPTFDGRFTF